MPNIIEDSPILEAIKSLEWFKSSAESIRQAIVNTDDVNFINDLAGIAAYIKELELVKITHLATSVSLAKTVRFERKSKSANGSDAIDFIFPFKRSPETTSFIFLLVREKVSFFLKTRPSENKEPILMIEAFHNSPPEMRIKTIEGPVEIVLIDHPHALLSSTPDIKSINGFPIEIVEIKNISQHTFNNPALLTAVGSLYCHGMLP